MATFKTIAVCLCALTSALSCSSDKETKKLYLADGQPAEINLAANETAGQIKFHAASNWSAWAEEAVSSTPGEIEWLRLEDTRGEAGESYLNFSLDVNLTEKERSAVIAITCEDETVRVRVTQTTESDDDPHPSTNTTIVKVTKTDYVYSGEYMSEDGTEFYRFEYQDNWLVSGIHEWRDDGALIYGDDYSLTTETMAFTYDKDSQSVLMLINSHTVSYPSKSETTETSEHFAEYNRGNITSGWYQFSGDAVRSNYQIDYDKDGRLLQTRNDDATGRWDTCDFEWSDGNLAGIRSSTGITVTLRYGDPSLINRRYFDLNWILPAELECYDFAAGDITRIFAGAGMLGTPSNSRLTEITESDGTRTYSYRISYTEDSLSQTNVTVDLFTDGFKTSSSKWIIEYTGLLD